MVKTSDIQPEKGSGVVAYKLVVTGKILSGHKRESVVQGLSSALKISPEKAGELLEGKARCIKRNLKAAEAAKYKKLLTSKGAAVAVTPMDGGYPANLSGTNAGRPMDGGYPANLSGTNSGRPKSELSTANPQSAKNKVTAKALHPAVKSVKKQAQLSDQKAVKKPTLENEDAAAKTESASASAQAQVANICQLEISEDFSLKSPSIFLSIWLGLITLGIGLVCLIYFAFLAGLGFLSIERGVSIFTGDGLPGSVEVVFLHMFPSLIALAVFTLSLRPFFPRPVPEDKGLSVTRETQPALFDFLGELCFRVGVPLPDSVFLTPDIDVKAAYQLGYKNLKDEKTEIKIGLTLFKVLSPEQLAGMIVHELWQFKNARLRYLTFFTKMVYWRLYRVVFGEDGWQSWIEKKQDNTRNLAKKYVDGFVRVLILLSAKFFFVFLVLAAAVVSRFYRKLVLLADDAQATMVGSTIRVATFLSLARADSAQKEALRRMTNFPGTLRLANDLSALIEYYVDIQPVETVKRLEDDMRSEQPRWYQGYPSIRERILRLQDKNFECLASADFAAEDLLSDYPVLSADLALKAYERLQLFVNREELVDIDEFTEQAREEMLREAKMQQYFNRWFRPDVFWVLPATNKAKTLKNSTRISLLNDAIARLRHGTPDYLKVLTDLPTMREKLRGLAIANEIRRASYGIPEEYFDPRQSAMADFSEVYQHVKAEYLSLLQSRQKYCEVMGLRVLIAISALPSKEDLVTGYNLVDILRVLEQQMTRLSKMVMAVSFVPVALARIQEKKESNHERRVQRIARDILSATTDTIEALKRYEWTLDSSHENAADFLSSKIRRQPNADSPTLEKVEYYYDMVRALEAMNQMINGQVAILAAKSEESLGVDKMKVAFV